MNSFRFAFWSALLLALFLGVFLLQLWQPNRQVRLHSEHLLRAFENKDWKRVEQFVAADYHDQWNNDRERLLERSNEVLRYLRNVHFVASEVSTQNGHWQARITVHGNANELMSEVQSRVNTLATPFDLEWRRASGKPWDYELVRVTNSGLTIPEFGE